MTSHRRFSDSNAHKRHKNLDIQKKKMKSKKNKKKIVDISSFENAMKNPAPITSDEANKEGTEDLAESVDSGCIPDLSSDIGADVMDNVQMKAALLQENIFITKVLRWLPASLQRMESEAKSIVDVGGSRSDLDQLQEKYQIALQDLRKNRNKNLPHATNRKEAKLAKKLKRLERRKVKRPKNKVTFSLPPELNKEKSKQRSSPTNVKPQKPIYNQNGELVFSKFDFSGNHLTRDNDSTTKSKDLKQILSMALKEKEKIRYLEKKGDKQGAISIAEQNAWSSALHRAEGKKVKGNMDMLKKSIKKQENRKKVSQKKWEQRLETVKKNKFNKTIQRKKNIATRKEAKLGKKMKKMKMKGHIVPGF